MLYHGNLIRLFFLTFSIAFPLKAPAEIPYAREERISAEVLGARKKQVPEVLLFPETLLKYGFGQNYLHFWVDRPLLLDRSTRYPDKFEWMTKKSFLRDVEVMKSYGMNGLGHIANVFPDINLLLYQNADRWLCDTKIKNFGILPEFTPGDQILNFDDKNYDGFKRTLGIALKSPNTPRHNGKVMIGSYNSDAWPLKNYEVLFSRLKKEVSPDFIVIGELAVENPAIQQLFNLKGSEQEQSVEKLKDEIQKRLDVFGGLIIPLTTLNWASQRKEYRLEGSTDFYYKHLLPIMLEVMQRPQNKDKLLGAVIKQCYINHHTGFAQGEFGTSRLRMEMDAAMAMNPDILIFFEWNEVNENTCFQPTVCNSFAVQRILKYYARKMRKQNPIPNEGDDQSIPNLVLSYRQTLKLGEVVGFELLNIPDSEAEKTYTAQLIINDIHGNVIQKFPLEKFTANQLRSITYNIPTEELAGYDVLVPVIEIINNEGVKRKFNGFNYVRLTPTVCWNYKEIRQTLRDMLSLKTSEFSVKINSDGTYDVKGEIDVSEPLASLEILDNEDEICAFDPKDEFHLDKNVAIKCCLNSRFSKMHKGTLRLSGVSEKWIFRPLEYPNYNFGSWKQLNDSVQLEMISRCDINPNGFVISLPKDSINTAELEFDFDTLGKFKYSVRDIVSGKHIGKSFEGGTYMILEKMDYLIDVPFRIGKKHAKIQYRVSSVNKFPVFCMRAISQSGKIYRSNPVIPKDSNEEKTYLEIYSDFDQKIKTVKVSKEKIPDIKYIFNPDHGDILPNNYGCFWNACLGGGLYYGEAGNWKNLSNIPSSAKNFNPEWTKINENWVLQFDGISNYINFPKETIPMGCFTMEFEIKPESSEPQILFCHFAHVIGSLNIFLKDGMLYASFTNQNIKTYKFPENHFSNGFPVPVGKWSKIKIVKKLNKIAFEINGIQKSYPLYEGRGAYTTAASFGGMNREGYTIRKDMKFFKGQLKSLHIIHCTE